jgi:DNA-binding SARP family transcriptional activator/tetratricopeptide (TPR) repeat protein
MQFGVLGPLRVADSGREITLGGPKQRIVVATLLAHANEVVSVDHLIGALWDEHPPDSARVTLQGLLKRIRQCCGEQARARIGTSPGGYFITVASGEYDRDQFSALTGQGRRAAEASDWRQAAELLAAGLALFRGDPFFDVPSDRLCRDVVPVLVELRDRATEMRIDADLRLGRHAGLLPELTGLVAARPLRERLTGQLMVALARTGRRAEALGVYRRAYAELTAELGVPPGPELAAIHERVLAGKRDPLGPAEGTGRVRPALLIPSTPERPCQLPSDITDFTGRNREIETIERLLCAGGPGVPVVLVEGPGGIGKTTLAVHAAHRLRSSYPDGQLVLRLGGAGQPVPPGRALGLLLRSLGVPPDRITADEDERESMLRALMADRRLLLLLDDAAFAAQVRPLLPGTAGCAAIVTSRCVLAGLAGAARLTVDVLPGGDACALLGRVVGDDRTAADPAAAAELAALCGGLPLAIRIAGARLSARPGWRPADLLGQLRDERSRMGALTAGDLVLRTSFEASYRTLPAEAARAFRLMAATRLPDLPVAAVAALLDRTPQASQQLAEELADLHLLTAPSPNRYRFHDLTRLFAREKLAESETEAALTRLGQAYAATGQAANAMTRPAPSGVVDGAAFRDAGEARSWLNAEQRNLIELVVERADRHDITCATDLLQIVLPVLRDHGDWDRADRASRAVLDAAVIGQDPRAELVARLHLGRLATLRGQVGAASDLLQIALGLAGRLGDYSAAGDVSLRLGLAAAEAGDLDSGLRWLRRAARLYDRAGNRRGKLMALINVVGYLIEAGRPLATRQPLAAATELARELDDPFVTVLLAHHRANRDAALGRYQAAIETHRESLNLIRSLGLREGEGHTLASLGRAHLGDGDPGAARARLLEALTIFEQLGALVYLAAYRIDLGLAQQALGDHNEAIQTWQRALATFEALGIQGNQVDRVRPLLATASQ